MSIKRLTTISITATSLALAILTTLLVSSGSFVSFIPSASAASATSTSATSSKSLGVTATVKDALSLALSSNTLSLDLTPTPNGIFKTDTFDATVSTSNQTGYTLYVASTGLDHNGEVTSNLIHSSPDVSSDSVISPLEGAVVVTRNSISGEYTDTSAFNSNHYGLSTDISPSSTTPNPTTTPTFKPVSTTNTIFGGYESNIEGDTTNFTFGTKVDTNIVAGTYSNTLTVTAIANPVYRTFTINYHPAGGIIDDSSLVLDEATGNYVYSDRIADEYYPEITISPTTPVKTGHTFLGYAISEEMAEAGTVTYQPGDKVTMDYESPSISLYAVWETNTYTLVYNANTGTGAPGSQSMTYGENITLSSTTPTKTGYTFLGWSLSSTATSATYSANTAYAVSTITDAAGITSHNGDSATLYAVWKINTYTVTFNVNGSGLSRNPTSRTINYGGSGTTTVTAASGYYISAASCTNGYTVSVTTGTSATGSRTATVYNNSKLANSVCTFTGVQANPCAKYGSGATKLTDGKCWRYMSSGAYWGTANTTCNNAGMHLPSNAEWDAYKGTTSWSGYFWSSTNDSGSYYYVYNVSSASASLDFYADGYAYRNHQVACTASP